MPSSPALDQLTKLITSGEYAGDAVLQKRAAPTLAPALQAAPAPDINTMSLADLEDEAKRVELRNKVSSDRASQGYSSLDPIQKKLAETYALHYGNSPRKSDGSLDMTEVSKGLRDLADEAEGKKLTAVQQYLLKDLPDEHKAKAFGPDGKVKSDAELVKVWNDAVAAPKPLDQKTYEEITGQLETVARLRTSMTDARERALGTGKYASAGRAVGAYKGDPIGRARAWIKSMGGSPDLLANQRQLTIFLNEQILDKMPQLKGPMSDKDREFLTKSVPSLSDPVKTWTDYMDMQETFLARREDYAKSRLAGGRPIPSSAAATVTPNAGGAQAATAAGGDIPLVSSMEDLKKHEGKTVRFPPSARFPSGRLGIATP